MSDIQGLSYREIAEVLAIPMGTVMSRLHNARKRLREVLGPGFLGGLLAVLFLPALAGVASGQAPPPPPPPPPTVAPGVVNVCVYALVILASNPPAPPGAPAPSPPPPSALQPTPPLMPPGATSGPGPGGPPPPLGTGCGAPVRLQPWVPRLQEVFGYSHYEPMSAFETTMPLGLLQRFALPGGRELQIQPLTIRPPAVRIAVKILRGPMTEIATVMDVPPRRPALIGGPPHGPGVLIIAIRSRP